KALHFPERTLAAVFSEVTSSLDEATVKAARSFAREHYVDVKATDARLLLETLRETNKLPRANRPKTARTRGLTLPYEVDRWVRHADADVPLRNIAARAALHEPDFDALNFAALNRALVQVLAEMLGLEVTSNEVDAELARFRGERALESEAELQ